MTVVRQRHHQPPITTTSHLYHALQFSTITAPPAGPHHDSCILLLPTSPLQQTDDFDGKPAAFRLVCGCLSEDAAARARYRKCIEDFVAIAAPKAADSPSQSAFKVLA
jgi:hypothetical protein